MVQALAPPPPRATHEHDPVSSRALGYQLKTTHMSGYDDGAPLTGEGKPGAEAYHSSGFTTSIVLLWLVALAGARSCDRCII